VRALYHLFPEIGLDPSSFDRTPGGHYQENENRRKFLEHFAKSNGFDPLIPSNWYDVTTTSVLRFKGGLNFLAQYKNNLAQALLQLFPYIGLDSKKISQFSPYYWEDITNRRNFFEKFAKEHGFDPLIRKNWYNIPLTSITSNNETRNSVVSHYYSGNMVRALLHVFPEIGLNPKKFVLKRPRKQLVQ